MAASVAQSIAAINYNVDPLIDEVMRDIKEYLATTYSFVEYRALMTMHYFLKINHYRKKALAVMGEIRSQVLSLGS